MSRTSLASILGGIRSTASKHSPEILTGIGIAGMIATAIMAVKATPRALELLKEAEEERDEKLTKTECVKVTWKCYIPSAVTGVTSVACLIGASSVNARRNAALAAAYTLSDSALREYKDKVVETFGEHKEKVVRDKIAEDRVKNDPVSKKEVILTEKGNTLCYDAHSGRYFKTDIDCVRKAENEINRRMVIDMYVSLNEFYDELGLGHTKLGDLVGWTIDDGLIEIDFSSQLADDGTPCLVIDYSIAPKYDYSSFV